jgi:3-deoxy-manno-octulosonate cytidylyltransferase (CMP-KDO synthetase)
MKTAIIIPARYGSTRLPGKPLAMIAGQTMLQRIVHIAQAAIKGMNPNDVVIAVATDDERIIKHAQELGVLGLMTPVECPTGSDRVEAAARMLDMKADFIMSFQGDAPLTPPDFITAMIQSFEKNPTDVVTPVTQMTWEQLDKLRDNKKTTPYSGTLAVFDEKTGKAFWFSKNIIPVLRKEEKMRAEGPMSPIFHHIGLYGYSSAMLSKYITLPEGKFEVFEGLEQLRVLENGYTIRCVPVDYKGRASMSGVDSPEDVGRAEALIAKHGELLAA